MAGVAGIEPAHVEIKTRCLTAWLHPNSALCSGKWCRKEDSNPWPDDYKSTALPTELLRHTISSFDLIIAFLRARARSYPLGIVMSFTINRLITKQLRCKLQLLRHKIPLKAMFIKAFNVINFKPFSMQAKSGANKIKIGIYFSFLIQCILDFYFITH